MKFERFMGSRDRESGAPPPEQPTEQTKSYSLMRAGDEVYIESDDKQSIKSPETTPIDHKDIGFEVLNESIKSSRPVQEVLFKYFDDHPELSPHDRLNVAESTHTKNNTEHGLNLIIKYVCHGTIPDSPDEIIDKLIPYFADLHKNKHFYRDLAGANGWPPDSIVQAIKKRWQIE